MTKKAPISSIKKKGGELLTFEGGDGNTNGGNSNTGGGLSLQENFKRFRKQKVKERRIMQQNKEELKNEGPSLARVQRRATREVHQPSQEIYRSPICRALQEARRPYCTVVFGLLWLSSQGGSRFSRRFWFSYRSMEPGLHVRYFAHRPIP